MNHCRDYTKTYNSPWEDYIRKKYKINEIRHVKCAVYGPRRKPRVRNPVTLTYPIAPYLSKMEITRMRVRIVIHNGVHSHNISVAVTAKGTDTVRRRPVIGQRVGRLMSCDAGPLVRYCRRLLNYRVFASFRVSQQSHSFLYLSNFRAR
jgi:hypothetical protein